MDPEIKAAWVEDLRSGKFEQGTCAMRRKINGTDHFCCLGILAERLLVMRPDLAAHRLPPSEKNTGDTYLYEFRLPGRINPDELSSAVIPRAIALEIGLETLESANLQSAWDKTNQQTLYTMNDNGEPFVKIADWIEENL